MDEPMFRGKRTDDNSWVYGFYFIDERDIEDGFIWRDVPQIQQRYGDHFNYFDVDVNTVGRFTGLVDDRGQKIYEGDIIKSVALDNDHHQRGAVTLSPIEYFSGNLCLTITYVPYYPFCMSHDNEVVGNIYDNPEMIPELISKRDI